MSTQSENFTEKIAEIKAKQEALMRQTSDELEVLQKSLLDSQKEEEERGPLVEEIKFLRNLVKELEQEKRVQENALHETRRQLQEVINSVKQAIHLPITEILPPLPLQTEEEAFFELPKPIKKALEVKKAKKALKTPSLPKVSLPRPKLPRLALRTVGTALFVALIYVTWTHSPFKSTTDTGQVAGVSTTSLQSVSQPKVITKKASFPDYKQSYSDVSFEDTTWEKMNDPNFGATIEWPSNASNRVGAVGGNNIWFLRKDMYLLKLTREAYTGSLDEWMSENKADYAENNSMQKTTFKDQPAWLIKPLSPTDGYGYEYIVKIEDTIYHTWIKTTDPASDDGQRITYMVTSLEFTK